jgi:DNA replication protein
MGDGTTFSGFPGGKPDRTPIPPEFFSELLTAIDDLGELRLTLYLFWAMARRPADAGYVRREDLAADPGILRALGGASGLEDALERCVLRGTLLKAQLEGAEPAVAYYFLNTPKGRAAAQGLAQGAWTPGDSEAAPLQIRLERPNVFTLYEQNIGPLTPMIADQLRDAEATYPAGWIEDAMRIAVSNNVRKWSYIQAILEDWEKNGKDVREDRGNSEKARRRYLEGKLVDGSDT